MRNTTPTGPITSLTDLGRYAALGWGNATPGAPDEDTLAWALDATLARVADAATDADRVRVLEWVREGERTRAQYENDRQWLATVDSDSLAMLDAIAQTARLRGVETPAQWRMGMARIPPAQGEQRRWQRAWEATRTARHTYACAGNTGTLRGLLAGLRAAS